MKTLSLHPLIKVNQIVWWLSLTLSVLYQGTHSQDYSCQTKGCFPPSFDITRTFSSYPLRSLSVSSICGNSSLGVTDYKSIDPADAQTYNCNASSVQPSNLIDDDYLQPTYWQSEKMISSPGTTSVTPQYIIVNFTDEFLLDSVYSNFLAPPNKANVNAVPAFKLQKMDSTSGGWTTLQYFAQECGKAFPGIPLTPKNSRDFNTAYCSNLTLLSDENFLTFDPKRLLNNQWLENPAAIARFTASAIQIYFAAPANQEALRSYVAVDYLEIEVACKCFGHAASCSGPNGATCNCQHNTAGQQCERCLPLYNNKPWRNGNTTSLNICEACTCNGHANSCVYDQVKGYGVCIDCLNNTTGDFCDTCKPGYYINPNRGNNSQNEPYCLECKCNAMGTVATEINTCHVATGQCTCKAQVLGRDCSECTDSFWGLGTGPDQGCNACNCITSGTVNNTNNCNKTTGQCPCKVNVDGSNCGQCKGLHYGYSASKPDGCSPCDCDPGASTQLNCSADFGQCACYGDIGGRDCKTPPIGTFIPRLDVIVLEPEKYIAENVVARSGHGTVNATVSGKGFVNLSSSTNVTMTFTSTYSGLVDCVVRYEKANSELSIALTATLTSNGAYVCSDVSIVSGQTWPMSNSRSTAEVRGGLLLGSVCINSGTSYTLVLGNSSGPLLVDSVVFIPAVSVEQQLLDRIPNATIQTCLQMAANSVRSTRTSCAGIEYSIMAFLLKKTMPCSCFSGAVNGTVCDSFSGDCTCLPGFLPPDCFQCASDTYQPLGSSTCIACECNKNGSVSDICDSQGNCLCRPNVQGRKCDACVKEYYGLKTGLGCNKCTCRPDYSLDNSCDDYGKCHCKLGVKGLLCDGCMEGYFNLTTSGCTQCACNTEGSAGKVCDVTTGLCQCLPRVEGSDCSQCKAGYFGLGKWNADGCVPCFCWGHSAACTSAVGWYSSSITSSFPSWVDAWTALDAKGSTISVVTASIGPQNAMRIETTQLSVTDIYFAAPKSFLGDCTSSYGRYLTFNLSPPGGQYSGIIEVLITGLYSDYTLVYFNNELNYSNASIGMIVKIPLHESDWFMVNKVSLASGANFDISNAVKINATYFQMMETLSAMASLYIKAYKANSSVQALDLLSVTLDTATTDSLAGQAVNNIEMCTCPIGYAGSSCQQCAPGYTRSSSNDSSPAFQCVPCSCNGHSVSACDPINNASCGVVPCDPTTGVCTCQHHTKGDHCEVCVQGYYGDPLKGTADDCKPCECPGLIVAQQLNVFATSCSLIGGIPVCDNCTAGHTGSNCQNCSEGYFGTPENVTNAGGKCLPCVCNGRADTCDRRTGSCINCQNNTAGQNCELCAPGFYGDAMNSQCQACNCGNQPGESGRCNLTTGACECLPNVYGSSCDQCLDMTYNLTALVGCQPCDCNSNGSTSQICDKTTGQCTCKSLVTGRTCGQCLNGYWNVNPQTGCDVCSCNASGTAKYVNGSVQETCDVITGQCTCSLPGIIGRTCDTCSPVSKSSLQYVHSFYLGNFPDCVLCGECYDSWGKRINDIGIHLAEMNATVTATWNDYNNQSAAEVSSALTAIEDNINNTTHLLARFEIVVEELQDLRTRFSEAQITQNAIVAEVNTLNYAEANLQVKLGTLTPFSDAVNVTSTSATSLATLRQQLDNLMALAESAHNQGNASYTLIQTMAFVVASPEERQQKLQEQAKLSMEFAAAINRTYTELKSLYDASLIPGSSERNSRLNDLDVNLLNVIQLTGSVSAIIGNITRDVDAASSLVSSLVADSTKARSDMLDGISKLELIVANASSGQRLANKVIKDAKNFKLVADKAEETMINSMTGILESVISLTQAQADLLSAQTLSLSVSMAQLPSLGDMQSLVQQIASSSVTQSDVANANLKSQQALFEANTAVQLTQKALSEARKLSEGIQLMKTDIADAQRIRQDAENGEAATKALNSSIAGVFLQASLHSSEVEANITQVIQLAEQTDYQLKNLSACFSQRGLDITNAVISSNQLKDRANSVSQAEAELTQVLIAINIKENDPSLTPALANLTQADSIIKKVASDLAQLEALAQLEILIPELQAQQQEINDLETEIDQLTSMLDNILFSLRATSDSTLCTS